jgi:hypothetical protein
MSKRNTNAPADNLLRLPIQTDVTAIVSAPGPAEPARVLDFRKPDLQASDHQPYESPYEMTYRQKIVRIVDLAVGKLDDNQLDSLLIEVERITGNGEGLHG